VNINATLIGQAISFAIFVWFCMKFVWPPLIAAMEERKKQMSDGLQNAELAEQALDDAKARAEENLVEAKQQAAELIDQANKRANLIVEEAKDTAKQEGERIKLLAEADIVQEVNRAKEDLRAQVSQLAIAGAEKILEGAVDQQAHSGMLSKLANEL